MKFNRNTPRIRSLAGITLIECLVYLAVFCVLTGVGLTSFYVCWDGYRAFISTTDDVSTALRAGERWRADVRDASGTISVRKMASGEVITIPQDGKDIIYSFNSGRVQRQAGQSGFSDVILPGVKSSEMKQDLRGPIKAWQWELELPERRKGPHLPLLFTFEAVPKTQ